MRSPEAQPAHNPTCLRRRTLLRAARKPEPQRFTLLRDVLRKRRARAAARDGAARPSAADMRPSPRDSRPPAAEGSAAGGPASDADGWRRYFQDTGISVETQVPARELTPRQARAAGADGAGAGGALSARRRGGRAGAARGRRPRGPAGLPLRAYERATGGRKGGATYRAGALTASPTTGPVTRSELWFHLLPHRVIGPHMGSAHGRSNHYHGRQATR